MFIKSKKGGESILEIIITLIIIMLAITSAFKTLSIAFVQKNLTRDRIIAINLAREGIEAVRYIREYNWLYYGSKQRVCWNHFEDSDNDGDVYVAGVKDDPECVDDGGGMATFQIGRGLGGDEVINNANDTGEAEYVLKQYNTHWYLSFKGQRAAPDLISVGDWAKLTDDNIATVAEVEKGSTGHADEDIVESFRLCKDNARKALFVSCMNGANSGSAEADPALYSKFFRYVKIMYGNGAAIPTQGDNIITVAVGVKWLERDSVQDVTLAIKLTDFYNRTYDDGKGI